jgi:mRNA interferase MazF
VQRGDVFRFKSLKGVGHEQMGERFGVVVQADEFLPRSVVLVVPTSRSARAATFRPEVVVDGAETRVLAEQLGAVDVLTKPSKRSSDFRSQVSAGRAVSGRLSTATPREARRRRRRPCVAPAKRHTHEGSPHR